MARNLVQVMVLDSDMQAVSDRIDWMDANTILPALGIEGTEGVTLLDQGYSIYRGCYILLCSHPGYPEVPDYEEPPRYPWTAAEVVPGVPTPPVPEVPSGT